jgi:Flp pilus assembly protein TadD
MRSQQFIGDPGGATVCRPEARAKHPGNVTRIGALPARLHAAIFTTREPDRISIVTRGICATIFLLAVSPAQAQWCANYQSGGRNCYFTSQAQCLASISGAGGTCSPTQVERPAAVERRSPPAPRVRRSVTPEKAKPARKEAPRQVRGSPPPAAASARPPTPGGLPAKFNEARLLVLEGQYEAGVAALHALDRDDHPDIATFLGLGYFKMGRNDQAVFFYDKVLTTHPNHLLTLSYYGMLRVSLGDLRNAQADLEKLRRLCGTDCNEFRALDAVISAQR